MEKIKKKIENYFDADFIENPSFPKSINVELVNSCNHKCNFCAYQFMQRKVKKIDKQHLEKVLKEAFSLGSREIGLHSGTEPLMSKDLEHFIKFCKDTGYEYVYFSTNGTIANKERIQNIIKSGIDSVKFSINAGNREMYKIIHGKDEFEKAISNLKEFYLNRVNNKPYIAVSFVKTKQNSKTANELRELVNKYIDEFLILEQDNQSGQMVNKEFDEPSDKIKKCGIPFKKIHISSEGLLRVCCNDYNNNLAVIDLKKTNLKNAFYSDEMASFRRKHIENDLKGTLCFNCLYNKDEKVTPLNKSLFEKYLRF